MHAPRNDAQITAAAAVNDAIEAALRKQIIGNDDAIKTPTCQRKRQETPATGQKHRFVDKVSSFYDDRLAYYSIGRTIYVPSISRILPVQMLNIRFINSQAWNLTFWYSLRTSRLDGNIINI